MTTRRRPTYRRQPWENPSINRTGGSRAWTRMRDRVVKEEPICRLRLPGCTIVSTTADHIRPKKFYPQFAMCRWNLRGSCRSCNMARGAGDRPPRPRPAAQQARALEFFQGRNG